MLMGTSVDSGVSPFGGATATTLVTSLVEAALVLAAPHVKLAESSRSHWADFVRHDVGCSTLGSLR
jgi:hypothetical protein